MAWTRFTSRPGHTFFYASQIATTTQVELKSRIQALLKASQKVLWRCPLASPVAGRKKFVTIRESPSSKFIATDIQPDCVTYTQTVALDISAIQTALQQDGLDGWLLYDFHGSNPIAGAVVEVDSRTKMTTRRWYCLIPATGSPQSLMHAIEPTSLAHVPGKHFLYADHNQLQEGLRTLLAGTKVLAMEYSPSGAIPYISRVDAGTIDAVRAMGIEVVSSGDLVQRFEATWSKAQLTSHESASDKLHRIKDKAFALISERLESSTLDEFELQQVMMTWFKDEKLVTDSPPVVAVKESTGNPHYMPTKQRCRPIEKGDIVLLDLWGKLDQPGSVFADITWVAYTGANVPAEYVRVFELVRAARDAAIGLVQASNLTGKDLRGWQVDRAARDVISAEQMGQYFVHRTGHSLGASVHGNGVHMDNYETHDDRRLLPGTGFTIEPGIYQKAFGIRSEINMYVGESAAWVTGPLQNKIVSLTANGSE